MKKAYHNIRALLLLGLLHCAVGVRAQAGLEYWFDNYSNPTTVPMPVAGGTLTAHPNCTKLSQGFHTVFFRIKAGDGTYSPVYSSQFIKFAASGVLKLEYWFDGDVKKSATCDISTETTDEQELLIDLTDTERFPLGIHQLNFRVAAYGGNYSPVYSSLVMKMPGGNGNSMLEYWFDDDITKKASQPINTNLDTMQKLELDMSDPALFPMGFHKLSMRVVAHGSQYSPVYTAYVMKLHDGPRSQITYWLDDNYQNGRHIVAAEKSDGQNRYFMPTLDFSGVPSGMHRLKFRITSNDFDDGVVYEYPVLVTRRYNSDQTNVNIVSDMNWVDDLAHFENNGFTPQSVVIRNYTLDPNDYQVGQHAFHIQYKNSASVWTEQNTTYFYKDAASGRLYSGFMSSETDGIDDANQSDYFYCIYERGTVIFDCLSSKLASTGMIVVYDLKGNVIAKQRVDNANGIHAEISVQNRTRQIAIVKFFSGEVCYTKKLMMQ